MPERLSGRQRSATSATTGGHASAGSTDRSLDSQQPSTVGVTAQVSSWLCKEFLTSAPRRRHTLGVPLYQSNVREYRQRAGLSQEALARELGVSRQTVVNIEKGLSEPKVLLAIALGAILGVALEELFRKGAT